MGLKPYLGVMRRMTTSKIAVTTRATSTSRTTSMEPAQTRSQKPAYSRLAFVSKVRSVKVDGWPNFASGCAGRLNTSPQNRQNSPSGNKGFPQLEHTCWTATAIGGEYYRL